MQINNLQIKTNQKNQPELNQKTHTMHPYFMNFKNFASLIAYCKYLLTLDFIYDTQQAIRYETRLKFWIYMKISGLKVVA